MQLQTIRQQADPEESKEGDTTEIDFLLGLNTGKSSSDEGDPFAKSGKGRNVPISGPSVQNAGGVNDLLGLRGEYFYEGPPMQGPSSGPAGG